MVRLVLLSDKLPKSFPSNVSLLMKHQMATSQMVFLILCCLKCAQLPQKLLKT